MQNLVNIQEHLAFRAPNKRPSDYKTGSESVIGLNEDLTNRCVYCFQNCQVKMVVMVLVDGMVLVVFQHCNELLLFTAHETPTCVIHHSVIMSSIAICTVICTNLLVFIKLNYQTHLCHQTINYNYRHVISSKIIHANIWGQCSCNIE